jgi:hypothetical protein
MKQEAEKKNVYIPNMAEWDKHQEIIWSKKPITEVESYYLNTKNKIALMKHSARGKPHALIAKKKAWRNGLRGILSSQCPAYSKPQKKPDLQLLQAKPKQSTVPRQTTSVPRTYTNGPPKEYPNYSIDETQPNFTINEDAEDL